MTIDIGTTIAIFAGVVIPFLVDLVTKDVASPRLKAALAFALSTLAGVLTTVAYDPNIGWNAYVFNVTLAFLSAMGTHYTGVTNRVQKATADIGIGKPRQTATDDPPAPDPVDPTPVAHTRPTTPRKKTAAKKATPVKKTGR